jgi:hypothetical protein
MHRIRTITALSALALAAALAVPTPVSAAALPSGERLLGGTTIEPAYDSTTGTIVYLSTPNGTQQGGQVHLTSKNYAPLWLPVYPVGSTVGTLNCAHVPSDNCPDHGPEIAGLAAALSGAVYGPANGSGVLGHDHLVGIASTGGDFNIIWEPIAIIFTPKALTDGATNVHMTTEAQVDAAIANGDAFAFPLLAASFKCASVSAATYSRGTPL